MRFVPPLAVLADGPVAFDGDEQAYARPMRPLLGRAARPRRRRSTPAASRRRPALHRRRAAGRRRRHGHRRRLHVVAVRQRAAAGRRAAGRRARGPPRGPAGAVAAPHRHDRGHAARARRRGRRQPADRWAVAAGPIAPRDVAVEPDLSNAAPFLAAAAVTGGTVTVPALADDDAAAGRPAARHPRRLRRGGHAHRRGPHRHRHRRAPGHRPRPGGASELTPVVAALAALARDTSHIRGVAHVRGHETDRLAALHDRARGARARASTRPTTG